MWRQSVSHGVQAQRLQTPEGLPLVVSDSKAFALLGLGCDSAFGMIWGPGLSFGAAGLMYQVGPSESRPRLLLQVPANPTISPSFECRLLL